MKPALLLMILSLAFCNTRAQTLKKYPVGTSGCSIYTYCDSKYKMEYSSDSSRVFTGECVNGEVTYGVICVKLLNPVDDLTMAEDLVVQYSDYLKNNFGIKEATGYGKGHRLNNNEKTRGIIDYWVDNEGNKWKIKAWTDGKFIGFMYAYSKKELPEQKVNVFLDGFRLPEK